MSGGGKTDVVGKRTVIESALESSEQRFRQVVEFAPNAMVMTDKSGRIEMVNVQTEKVFGYARSDLLGQPIEMLLPPRFRGHHPALRDSFSGAPESRPMGAGRDLYGLRRDGSEFPVEIGLNPMDTEDGAKVLASVVDITERKRSMEQAGYLAAIVESSTDAIISKNLDGVVTTWNPAAERLFGYAAADIIGRHVSILLPPDRQSEEGEILARVGQGECVEHFETRRLCKGGREIAVSLTISPIRGPGGKIVGASKIAREITERQQANQALQESAQQIKRERDTAQRYLDLAGAVIVALDIDGNVTLINDRGCVIFEYDSPTDIIGKPFIDTFIPASMRPTVWDAFRRLVGGADPSIEFYTSPCLTKAGEIRLIAWHNSLLTDEKGHITGTLSSGEDITERTRAEVALRESTELIKRERDTAQRYLDVAGVMILVLDADARVSLINQRGCEILDYDSPDEIVGKFWIDNFVPPRLREETWKLFKGQIGPEHAGPRSRINSVLTNSGEERLIAWNHAILTDENGHGAGTLSSGEDITERNRAEVALRESNERIVRERDTAARYLDVAGIMILALDADANVTLINRHGSQVLGYNDPNEIVGKSWVDNFIPERLRAETRAAFLRAIREDIQRDSGKIRTNFVLTKAGEERLIVWLNAVLTNENGQPGLISSGEDITDRKKAEDALIESEERYRRIVDNSPLGIILIDLTGLIILQVNPAYCEMLGYSSQELVGHSVNDFTHPEDRGKPTSERIRGEQVGVSLEKRYINKSGGIVWARVSATILRGNSGSSSRSLAVIEDITDRKRIEEQLHQAQKMEAIGQLTGGMAHDFNNLLGVIVGNLDLLRSRRKADAIVDELAGEALDAALSGADLTRRLLAFARRQTLQPEHVDLNEMIGSTTKLLKRVLGEHIEISLDMAEDVCPVLVDPAQLEAALTNLATNARDAMTRGGKLLIATGHRHLDADYASSHPEVTAGDYAMVEVTDTGGGITPEVLDHIFEPFFTTKGRDQGTGLGLSMVFGFMKQSGGHVSVYSEVGVGTTFRLYLPCTHEAEERTASAVMNMDSLTGNGETVLVVEDSAPLRRIVVRQLKGFGYVVLEARNGVEALQQLEATGADLLFTDIVMPGGIDGFELANVAARRWPNIRVLLTSGFPETKLQDEFKSSNFRLLTKPYRKEELAHTIRETLDSTNTEKGD